MSKLTKTATIAAAACILLQQGRARMMSSSTPKILVAPTNALVLGSGGLLGAAWMASSLKYLQDKEIWVQENDDLRIGTSAGSLLAILLGQGFKPAELITMLSTGKSGSLLGDILIPTSPTREKVPFRPSDINFILRTLKNGRSPHLGTFVSSLFDEGVEETEQIEAFVNEITSAKWPITPTWLVSAELRTGMRKVFDANSQIAPGKAVAASCAVPALYRPVLIGSNRYIDGGTISCHNLDLAINSGAKQITILVPIFGYTKIDYNKGTNQALNQFVRNTEQFSIEQLKKRLKPDIKLQIVSPGPAASSILAKGSLMDSSRLQKLILVSEKEVPRITKNW